MPEDRFCHEVAKILPVSVDLFCHSTLQPPLQHGQLGSLTVLLTIGCVLQVVNGLGLKSSIFQLN